MASDLELNAERYALAIDATDGGLWDWDLKNNKVFYSNRWKSMLGYNNPEAIGDSPKEWFERLHPDDLEKFQFSVESYLQGRSNYFKAEYRIRHEQGYYLWMLCQGRALWDKVGKPIRFVGFQTDITVKKNREQQLFYDAFHDPLTGLSNRALFMDRLNQALHSRSAFAILYMDMDSFKYVNDTLGHSAGDELLAIIARRLETCNRAGDTIARFGGDEFTILLNNIVNTNEIKDIAKRIIKEISIPITIKKQKIYQTITIGIALGAPSQYNHPEDVMRDADIALYQAKETKKGGYKIFNENMHQLTVSHLRVETDLKHDLKRGKILFYYQPIIDLKTGEIVGLEALLRWKHKQRGILEPATFLALAKETRLIVNLEKGVLENACKQLKILGNYIKNKNFFITFNISDQHLREKDFIKNLQRTLKCSMISPSHIHLEISENTLMDNPEYMEEILNNSKELGFKLSLDHFGTGHSSLTYLYRYPFDYLKLNHPYIIDIDLIPKKAMLINNIIKLAKSLGITVIAAGVEAESFLKILRSFHFKFAQGFYFSKPLPIEEIIDLLQKNSFKLKVD